MGVVVGSGLRRPRPSLGRDASSCRSGLSGALYVAPDLLPHGSSGDELLYVDQYSEKGTQIRKLLQNRLFGLWGRDSVLFTYPLGLM